jgi:hypothetical protein
MSTLIYSTAGSVDEIETPGASKPASTRRRGLCELAHRCQGLPPTLRSRRVGILGRERGERDDEGGEDPSLEADHGRHAEIENAIRDLTYGVGLNHLPSGRFAANGAWLAVQVMAHCDDGSPGSGLARGSSR